MIIMYGVAPEMGERNGELALGIIARKYGTHSHILTAHSDNFSGDYTFDVSGRTVNVHAPNSHAVVKICGANQDEIKVTAEILEKLLKEETPQLKFERL